MRGLYRIDLTPVRSLARTASRVELPCRVELWDDGWTKRLETLATAAKLLGARR
jgi:hypothetical protein